MFDYLIVLISVIAFWIMLGIVGVLFLTRLYVVIKDKLELKKALLVTLLPFSLGYFYSYKEKNKIKTTYQILIIIQFVLMLIGLILIIYTRYM